VVKRRRELISHPNRSSCNFHIGVRRADEAETQRTALTWEARVLMDRRVLYSLLRPICTCLNVSAGADLNFAAHTRTAAAAATDVTAKSPSPCSTPSIPSTCTKKKGAVSVC
jgi:hypothetical protein